MKVFISWSGTRSKALAVALREWLPLVLQYVDPWVSEKDIAAGDRWAQAIADELESSNFGIICITPENLTSQWVLFEAGALSKSMQDAKVIPLLFGLENSDITGPLAQFQAQKVDQAGLTEIIQAINNVAENKASNEIIAQLVPAVWPKLASAIDDIPDKEPSEKHMRPSHEILEELVTGVRSLNSQMREFDPEMSDRSAPIRKRRVNPKLINDLLLTLSRSNNAVSYLFLAGILRDDWPWLAEILLESYKEIKNGNLQSIMQLRQSIGFLIRQPIIEELLGRSKGDYMITREVARMIEHHLERSSHIIMHAHHHRDDDIEGENLDNVGQKTD